MTNFNLNLLVLIVVVASGILFVYPILDEAFEEMNAERIVINFKKISFALNLYFYTEGFGPLEPSEIDLKTLVNRYYLISDPGENYGIFWLDSNVKDDGVIRAIVYYRGSFDPVAMKAVEKDTVWFKDDAVSKNYSDGSAPGVVVEVRKTW